MLKTICLNMMLHQVTFMNAASLSHTKMLNRLLWRDKMSCTQVDGNFIIITVMLEQPVFIMQVKWVKVASIYRRPLPMILTAT